MLWQLCGIHSSRIAVTYIARYKHNCRQLNGQTNGLSGDRAERMDTDAGEDPVMRAQVQGGRRSSYDRRGGRGMVEQGRDTALIITLTSGQVRLKWETGQGS